MTTVTDKQFAEANERGDARLLNFPAASSVHRDHLSERIVIKLSTGAVLTFSPRDVDGLVAADAEKLSRIEISPSGHGLHFPLLDVDVDIPLLFDGCALFLASRNAHQKKGPKN